MNDTPKHTLYSIGLKDRGLGRADYGILDDRLELLDQDIVKEIEPEPTFVTEGVDGACVELCKMMNLLPGIRTTESCCGHGKTPFHIWFYMDTNLIGADVTARCLSGRYHNYFPGELRSDPCWRVYVADSDAECRFVLEGKQMAEDADLYEPAEKLAKNIKKHVDENFVTMYRCRKDMKKIMRRMEGDHARDE